jgi:hypothetical protein
MPFKVCEKLNVKLEESDIQIIQQHIKDCPLTNTFCLTKFGSVMKKL